MDLFRASKTPVDLLRYGCPSIEPLLTNEVKRLMPQTVLPFKLEPTDEQLTAHGGLALFGEFLQAMYVPQQLNAALPAPGSRIGYHPSQFVEPLLLLLHGGGRTLEDLRQIREDVGLRVALRLPVLPSADATGDWLRRMGDKDGLAG